MIVPMSGNRKGARWMRSEMDYVRGALAGFGALFSWGM